MRTARNATSSPRRLESRRRRVMSGPGGADGGQLPAAGGNSARHGHPQYRVHPGQGELIMPCMSGKATLASRTPGGRNGLVCPAAKSAACRPSAARRSATSNPEHMKIVLGKAGRKRWLGRRPGVRRPLLDEPNRPPPRRWRGAGKGGGIRSARPANRPRVVRRAATRRRIGQSCAPPIEAVRRAEIEQMDGGLRPAAAWPSR